LAGSLTWTGIWSEFAKELANALTGITAVCAMPLLAEFAVSWPYTNMNASFPLKRLVLAGSCIDGQLCFKKFPRTSIADGNQRVAWNTKRFP
jgi:hypothetical protein